MWAVCWVKRDSWKEEVDKRNKKIVIKHITLLVRNILNSLPLKTLALDFFAMHLGILVGGDQRRNEIFADPTTNTISRLPNEHLWHIQLYTDMQKSSTRIVLLHMLITSFIHPPHPVKLEGSYHCAYLFCVMSEGEMVEGEQASSHPAHQIKNHTKTQTLTFTWVDMVCLCFAPVDRAVSDRQIFILGTCPLRIKVIAIII